MMRVLALLALTACADLSPVQAGCHDGFLDKNEDCDTRDPSCVACGWTCKTDLDCASLPAPRDGTQYRCGADEVCHAPGGLLSPQASAQPFSVSSFFVSDVDHDHIGDVVGLSADSLMTRLGDIGGQLASERETLTPTIHGAPTIADLDHDGSFDVLVPARDGVVAYASPQDSLSPFAFAQRVGNIAFQPRAIVPIDGKRIVVFADNPNGQGGLVAGAVDSETSVLAVGLLQLCDPTLVAATFEQDSLSYHDATGPDGRPSVGISFIASTPAHERELCVMRVTENLGPTITYAVAHSTPDFPPVPATKPVIASVDASGCPSLVISDGGPAALQYYPGISDGQTCGLSTTLSTLPAIPSGIGDVAIGAFPLKPRVPGLAPDALVMKSGIYGIGTTGVPLYVSDGDLDSVSDGDIDGDGDIDAVATAFDNTIEVLYRIAGTTPSFLRVRLPTNAPPQHLVVADFDGNGDDDIAYVEARGSGEALRIAYGTGDRPEPAVDVAEFSQVVSLVPVKLVDSTDPGDRVGDLAVVDERQHPDKPPDFAVAIFHGSPDRAMIPFVDPRGFQPQSTFQGVAGGTFVKPSAMSMSSARTFDLFMLEVPDAGTDDARLWMLGGADTGVLYATVQGFMTPSGMISLPATSEPQIGSCVSPLDATFCTDGSDRSRFLTWPGAVTDRIVGIDPTKAQAVVIDPATLDFPSQTVQLTLQPARIPELPAMSTLRAAFVADIDGDGANELVIAFEAPGGPPGVLACTVTATVTCRDLIAQVPALALRTCSDAAPGRIARLGQTRTPAPETSTDLIVQCGFDVFRLFHAGGAFDATPLVTLPLTDTIEGIAVGDVTGDAVDDLLVHVIDSAGMHRLRVYPQLTSREAP